MKSTSLLVLRAAPHAHARRSTERIMWDVVLATLPALVWAVWSFGTTALTLLAASLAGAMGAEWLGLRRGRSTAAGGSLADGSAVVTGVLFAMTLPPSLPLWMAALGAALGVLVAKVAFGGLGSNLFNPALVGRALLQAAFPAAMTTWMAPFGSDRFSSLPPSTLAWPLMQPTWDGTSGATALSEWKLAGSEVPSSNLLIGFANGSLGETSAVLLALGGVYLLWRRVIGPAIPLVILGTVAVLSASIHAIAPLRCPSPLFMLGAGGLMLGAVFMATDPVASPMTTRGRLAYGGLIGVLVVVIRVAGGLPEGVMYAILFANAVSPLLDRLWQPRVFGTGPLGGPRGAT